MKKTSGISGEISQFKELNMNYFEKIISKIFFFLSFILIITSIAQGQNSQYTYSIPQKLNDGWEVASLASAGINPDPISEISARIRDINQMDEVLSMLIVKNGKLVHEVYSPYCQRNTLHWMASITKTVTSTLIGIAIDKGFLKDANTSVAGLLPEFADAIKDPKFRKIY